MKKLSPAFSLLVLFGLSIQLATPAIACGPFTTDPFFSFTRHGDYPLEKYAAGDVGIVPSTYGRMSLLLFYRELSELPLSKTEQERYVEALKKRIGVEEDSDNKPMQQPQTEDPVQSWAALRKKVLTSEVNIDRDKSVVNGYNYYTNCLDDAFVTATKTLENRIASHGNSEAVLDWLKGQDDVFSNCGKDGRIPSESSAGSPTWLKQDRAYQIGAAHFYRGEYDKARQRFYDVVKDTDSPWNKTARLVIARAFIREASLIDDTEADYEVIGKSEPPNDPVYSAAANAANSAVNTVATAPANKARRDVNATINAVANAVNAATAGNMVKPAANAPAVNAPANAPMANTIYPRTANNRGANIYGSNIVKSIEQKKSEKQATFEKAESQLREILSDASMSDFHASANRLFNLLRYRSNPEKQREELAARLMSRNENKNFNNDVTDFIWLLDAIERKASAIGQERDRNDAESKGARYDYDYKLQLRDVEKKDMNSDLIDWIITYQAVDGYNHAVKRWQETKKIQWLVAAMSKADVKSEGVEALMNDAGKIKPGSAAYATVRYHMADILLRINKREEAQKLLDEVLANGFESYGRSTQNKFYSQRMVLSRNLDDFLKYAQRKPAAYVGSYDSSEAGENLYIDKNYKPWKDRALFDDDSAAFLNERMPISVLRQAALSKTLPSHMRKFLVEAVWTRAFMLGRQDIVEEFTPLMSNSAPEYSSYFNRFAKSANPIDKEATGLLTILRYPVMQPYVEYGLDREIFDPKSIDSNRGNWWCAEDQAVPRDEYEYPYQRYYFKYPSAYPEFLTAQERSAAQRELKQLNSLGASATALTNRVIIFATKNPGHPLTPQLLHFAVRSTRYGCKDKQTLALSKAAFNFLHKRFPGNEWAKKTPHYFG